MVSYCSFVSHKLIDPTNKPFISIVNYSSLTQLYNTQFWNLYLRNRWIHHHHYSCSRWRSLGCSRWSLQCSHSQDYCFKQIYKYFHVGIYGLEVRIWVDKIITILVRKNLIHVTKKKKKNSTLTLVRSHHILGRNFGQLKRQSHEIFDLLFFSSNIFPWATVSHP